MQLNWKHQFEFAAFYAALAQGYYAEAGLNVTLREGGPGIDPVEEVISGRADTGVANSALALEHARNKPVVALAALMQHSAFALLARRAQGIDTIGDLDGKRVSCAAHACDEIRAYLNSFGLHEGRVTYVPMVSASIEDNLKISEATDIFLSNQGYQILGRESDFVLFVPRSAGIDLYGDILFTARPLVERRPEAIAAFRSATARGLEYAFTHQDELVELILAHYNTQKKSREQLTYEATKLYELSRPDLVEPGYMSAGRWRHVRDVYAGLGMMPADYPIEKLIYQSAARTLPTWLPWAAVALAFALLLALALAEYLRRINRRLSHEIVERTRAEVALQAGQDQFRRFVDQANSLVAHEVRTPLSILQVHLDILRLKHPKGGDGLGNFAAMDQAILRLQVLFEKSLKQVFDSTSFFTRQQTIDLGSVVRHCLDGHAMLTDKKSFAITESDGPLTVVMSKDMLETAINNLLENAMKYAPAGSVATVALQRRGNFAQLEVSNPSLHVLPVNPERFFEKHARGESTHDTPGTGVGLYLVRLIAQAHGGWVGIATDAPNIFRVQLNLPLNASPDPATP